MNKKILLFPVFAVSLIFLLSSNSYSQDKWWKEKKYKNEAAKQKHDLCKKTFKDIGYGFSNNSINSIKTYFDTQVYLNVAGSEKGYYSSNQTELILVDFMEYFKVDNFKYLNSGKYNSYAFANGTYTYTINSRKQNLKVAVSLKYYGNKWFVDQITIN